MARSFEGGALLLDGPSAHTADALRGTRSAALQGRPMIPRDCKRLAEVDFPIAVVSRHAVREKSIRHGHPSTLHLWWARRPLAACRAMLLALLLPDPCEALCPPKFKDQARTLLTRIRGRIGLTDEDLRRELLRFIGD